MTPEPLTDEQVECIQVWCETRLGGWVPPDAVRAVQEGRPDYKSLDGHVRNLTKHVEPMIKRAFDSSHMGTFRPPTRKAAVE